MLSLHSAAQDDIPAILTLNAIVQNWHNTHDPKHFRKDPDPHAIAAFFTSKLEDTTAFVTMAHWSTEPAGFLFCSLKVNNGSPFTFPARHLHAGHLAVAPAFRRQGIATRLLDHATSLAKAKDCTEVNLTSWAANSNAHTTFESGGFAKTLHKFAKPL